MLKLAVAFALVGFISVASISGDFFVSLRLNEIQVTNKHGCGVNIMMTKHHGMNAVGMMQMDAPALIQIFYTEPSLMVKKMEFIDRQIDMEGQRQSDILYEIFSQFRGPLTHEQYLMLLKTVSECVKNGEIHPSVLKSLAMVMRDEDMMMDDVYTKDKMIYDRLPSHQYLNTHSPTIQGNMMMKHMMRGDMMGDMRMPLRTDYTNLMMNPMRRHSMTDNVSDEKMTHMMRMNMMDEDMKTNSMMGMGRRNMYTPMMLNDKMKEDMMLDGRMSSGMTGDDLMRRRMMLKETHPMSGEMMMMKDMRMPMKTRHMDMMMTPMRGGMMDYMMMRPMTSNMMTRRSLGDQLSCCD